MFTSYFMHKVFWVAAGFFVFRLKDYIVVKYESCVSVQYSNIEVVTPKESRDKRSAWNIFGACKDISMWVTWTKEMCYRKMKPGGQTISMGAHKKESKMGLSVHTSFTSVHISAQ